MYTVWSKVLGLIFLKIEDTRGRHIPIFHSNKLHWHIYRLLCCRTISENLPKIPLFGPSFIHQLRLLGSQQHLQSGVLLTQLFNLGTDNSLVEINLEWGGRVIKGCNIFWGQKLANTCSFVSGRIIVQQNLVSRTHLDKPPECASGDNPLLLYIILHLLFFRLVRILCALLLESRKKSYQHDLDAGPCNFSFFGRGDVSPTHSEFCRFVSGS
jgi:hypothetical protein